MTSSREDILAKLRELAGGVPARGGAVCLLAGPAGMGKTHLAQRFIEQLPPDTIKLVGAGLQTGTPTLMPICWALVSDKREPVEELISATFYEYSQAIPLLKETLGPLLKVRRQRQLSGRLPPDLVPKETYTFFVLAEIFRRLSDRALTVLFIDDVQWLDRLSVMFLGLLFQELARIPVLVVLAARTDGTEPPILTELRNVLSRAKGPFLSFVLPPLSAREVIHVAERCLEGPLDHTPEDVTWLQHNSKGNPKYLQELVAWLKEQGALKWSARGWRFAIPPSDLVLLPSLKDMTLTRLAALLANEPDGERLVHYAAVCGRRFEVRVVARLAQVTPHRAMSHLKRIASATGFIERIEGTTEWKFDHELTREAILGELGQLARDLHHDVAEVLEQDQQAPLIAIAYHRREAGEWRLAAGSYGRVAAEAADRFAFEEAVAAARQREEMLDRAGCPGDAEERLESAERLGHYLVSARRYRDAAEYLAKFRELGIARSRFHLLHDLARALLHLPETSSRQEAVALLRTALARLEPDREPAVAVLLWTELMLGYDSIGQHDNSEAAFRKACAAATKAKDSLWLVRLMRLTGMFRQPEKVIRMTAQALAIARRKRFRFEVAACLNNLGTQFWYRQDLDRARKYFDSAHRVLLASCGGYRKEIPINNLGLLALVEGEPQRARELFRQVLACSLPGNDRLLIRINLAVAEAMAGELALASKALRELVVEADATGDNFYSDCVRYNLARVLLQLGEAAGAAATLENAPLRHWTTDHALIRGKRAALLAEVYAALGRAPDPDWARQQQMLEVTKKRQVWLYRIPWELCDIQFWRD